MRCASATAAIVALAALSGCSQATPPPLGDLLVIVDTDTQAHLASRLRIDVYDGDRWIASNASPMSQASSWPASFPIHHPGGPDARALRVRVRVYPEGFERAYLGERYTPRGSPLERSPDPAPTTGPQLEGGATPVREPMPYVTIDRLVHVVVTPGVQQSVMIKLSGECSGNMVDLAGDRSCVEHDGELLPAMTLAPSDSLDLPPSSVGTWGLAVGCADAARPATVDSTGASLYDDDTCIAGGAALIGSADTGDARITVFSPFFLDRWEMTVGHYRALRVRHGTLTSPTINDADYDALPGLPESPGSADFRQYCSYTTDPGAREDRPVVCIDAHYARVACQLQGGDLPTYAQYVYAALAVGRQRPARFPFSGADGTLGLPSCTQVTMGRGPANLAAAASCSGPSGARPGPETGHAGGDENALVSPPIENLVGNVEEYMREALVPAADGLHDPILRLTTGEISTGISWAKASTSVSGFHDVSHVLSSSVASDVGFRCMRPAVPK